MKPPKQGVTLRAAAREVGCTHPAILHAVKVGHLTKLPDGTIDLADVRKWWASHVPTNRGRPRKDGTTKAAAPTKIDDPVDELMASRGIFADRAAAELHRATYAALAEELEYEQLAGSVVEVAEVATAVGKEYAAVRTKLLAIPAEQAPRLHACRTIVELQDALLRLVTDALEALTIAGSASSVRAGLHGPTGCASEGSA